MTIEEATVLLFLFLQYDVFEVERERLSFNNNGKLVVELYREPVSFEFLDETDH